MTGSAPPELPQESDVRWESVGPFKDYRLLVNGWRVPLLRVVELDGGRVHVTLDERFGLELHSIAEANRVIPFLADVIAVAIGLPSWPMADAWYEQNDFPNPFDDPLTFVHVHPALRPNRVKEIGAVRTSEEDR